MFRGRSIAKDRSCLVCSADAPDYRQRRSSQAIGDDIAVSDGEFFVEKRSEPVRDVVGGGARPVLSEIHVVAAGLLLTRLPV